MSTKIGIGFSNNLNFEKAARQAGLNAKSRFVNEKIDLAIIFSSIHYEPQKIIPHIQKILNPHRAIGCSSAGIILPSSIEKKGIAILAIHSEDLRWGIGSINFRQYPDIKKAGMALAQNCISDYGEHNRHGFLYFADHRMPNPSAFLRGTQEIFGKFFPIVGASTSDDFHFQDTFQLFENQALQHSAIGVILGGHGSLGIGSSHGWRPLGKPRIISSSHNNIIKSIDGQRAAHFYEEYFSQIFKDNSDLPRDIISMLYPLGVHIKETNQFLIRNVVEILPDGSLVCQGDIPQGAVVHIMISNKSLCLQSASEAAHEALTNLRGKEPKAVIMISSMARLKLLGRSAYQETEKIKKIFGDEIPIIGMYSASETYPFRSHDEMIKSEIQNEGLVILTIH